MKTKYFILAATAITMMVSCADEKFVGDPTLQGVANGEGAIAFNSGFKAVTRADKTGLEAAKLLNNNFVVEGVKTIGSDPVSEVFDNYNVNYVQNTAATTASNTANWEYVAQSVNAKSDVAEQSIKYWDFAAKQYDFWAYSLGGGTATVSTLAHNANLGTGAYTITADKTNMAKVYISDLVTAYNPDLTVSGRTAIQKTATEASDMGKEVNLNFRSLVSKVRVGLYETVPGYSVRNVLFYPASGESPTSTAALYASSNVIPTFKTTSPNDATYTVTFPTRGVSNIGNSDYNKAHVTLTSAYVTNNVVFGTLTYGPHQDGKKEKTGYTAPPSESWTNIWVQRQASDCTWATEGGASAGDYSIVIPNETGAVLTLKVDYTLESIDGTGETIVVHGATALIPDQFTQWKPNYAYTYIFKISDNTNGLTNVTNSDKVGLYPITLDAVVLGSTDGVQETISTVATPSIITYCINSDATTNNEYDKTKDDIYVTATTDGSFMDMTDKATLYDISKASAVYAATEAEVLEALTKYKSISSGTYTGRNSVVLTPVNALDLTDISIPTVDGQSVDMTDGTAALIDKTDLDAGHVYAYVFDTTPSSPTTTEKYEAIATVKDETVVTGYYTRSGSGTGLDPYVYTKVTVENTKAADGVTYYDKYTESTATYAIKVIKVKS